ncbi:unnamed protein product [Arctogadus glacialis]
MSNVQLSTAALERIVARRTFPLHARTGACRNLFGPIDHDELNRDMKSKLREISERDQQRWNFNFEANSPLVGNYQWVESSVEATPGFYQDSVQTGKTRVAATPVRVMSPSEESDIQESPAMDVPPTCEERLAASEISTAATTCPAEVNQENRRSKLNSGIQTRSRQSSSCVRRKRTAAPDNNNSHITDFFVKRKRSTENKSTESPCLSPKTQIPVEQTPRKRIR